MKNIAALFVMTNLAFAACGPAPLEEQPTRVLTVGTTLLDFGEALVDEERVREVSLNAFGTEDVRVSNFVLEGDFSHDAGNEIIVPAGQTRRFNVRFSPSEISAYEGTFRANSDAVNRPRIEISLLGEGVEEVKCEDDSECVDHTFDEALGRCVYIEHQRVCDDGLRCTEDDVCQNGVCSGEPLECNDSVDCTEDRCTEAQGCVFEPRDDLCADSACSIGSCSDQGCVDDIVADNTRCGEATSCSAQVCLSGLCERLDADEGRRCSDGDSCTLDDECSAGLCVSGQRVAEAALQSVQKVTGYVKDPQRVGDTLFGSEGYGLKKVGAEYERRRFVLPLVERWVSVGDGFFGAVEVESRRTIIADLRDLDAPFIRSTPFEVLGGGPDHAWGCDEDSLLWAERAGTALFDLRNLGPCPRDMVAGDDVFISRSEAFAISGEGVTRLGLVPGRALSVQGKLAYFLTPDGGVLVHLGDPEASAIETGNAPFVALSSNEAIVGESLYRFIGEGFSQSPLSVSGSLFRFFENEAFLFDDGGVVFSHPLLMTRIFERRGELEFAPTYADPDGQGGAVKLLKDNERFLMVSGASATEVTASNAPALPEIRRFSHNETMSWVFGEDQLISAGTFGVSTQRVTIDIGQSNVLPLSVLGGEAYESVSARGCVGFATERVGNEQFLVKLDTCPQGAPLNFDTLERVGPFQFTEVIVHEDTLTLINERSDDFETDFSIIAQDSLRELTSFTIPFAVSPTVSMDGNTWVAVAHNTATSWIHRAIFDSSGEVQFSSRESWDYFEVGEARIVGLRAPALFVKNNREELELWDMRNLSFVRAFAVEFPLNAYIHDEGVAIAGPTGLHELSVPCLLR